MDENDRSGCWSPFLLAAGLVAVHLILATRLEQGFGACSCRDRMRGAGSKLEEDVKERLSFPGFSGEACPAAACQTGSFMPLRSRSLTSAVKQGSDGVLTKADQRPSSAWATNQRRFKSIALSTCHQGKPSLELS